MRLLLRRLRYLVRRRRFEADLADEVAFHREMTQRELEARGLKPAEAVRATRRALGSFALAQDHARDVWQPRWLQGVGQDLRLAVRALRTTPIVSGVAILSLALGIGANAAIFSLVNSLLLRPLPVKDAGRLVLVTDGAAPGIRTYSYAVWDQLNQRPALFDGIAAWSFTQFNLAAGGETEFVNGLWASSSFFATLRVPMVLGRTPSDLDGRRSGGPNGPVMVISYKFWQQHFGGAEAIGRPLVLDGMPFTIVGITPPASRVPSASNATACSSSRSAQNERPWIPSNAYRCMSACQRPSAHCRAWWMRPSLRSHP
jgi:hypothetical protein